MNIPPQATVTERHVETAGARLWYWDTGGGGEAIVLCHPASQGTGVWLYQQPVFARAGYRVIAYARRGYDRSERGTAGDPGTTVGDLIALLDCLGIDRAHVLGAAAGGITVLAFAVAHPERCRSLVLAGTIFSPAEDEWRKAYARLGMAAAKDALPVDFLELGPTYRFVNPEGVDLFVKLSEEARRADPQPQPSGVSVTWQELRRLDVATLMLTGEADLYAPPPLQSMMARHIRRHELVTLPEVGHAAYWERPQEFNEIVLRFLAKHAGQRD